MSLVANYLRELRAQARGIGASQTRLPRAGSTRDSGRGRYAASRLAAPSK